MMNFTYDNVRARASSGANAAGPRVSSRNVDVFTRVRARRVPLRAREGAVEVRPELECAPRALQRGGAPPCCRSVGARYVVDARNTSAHWCASAAHRSLELHGLTGALRWDVESCRRGGCARAALCAPLPAALRVSAPGPSRRRACAHLTRFRMRSYCHTPWTARTNHEYVSCYTEAARRMVRIASARFIRQHDDHPLPQCAQVQLGAICGCGRVKRVVCRLPRPAARARSSLRRPDRRGGVLRGERQPCPLPPRVGWRCACRLRVCAHACCDRMRIRRHIDELH
jgi:hypothetical protein